MSGPEGHNPFHNIVVKYRIWTAHSGEKKADVYCVTQEITLFNQDLKCGPSDKYKWYDGREWGPWKELKEKVSDLCKNPANGRQGSRCVQWWQLHNRMAPD